jgi:hypothetical protein
MAPVRALLLIFLALLTYDGALRKWALPSAETVLFLLKDAVLAGSLGFVLLGGLYRRARIDIPQPILNLLGFYALWVIVEALNPHLPNILVGIWGLKAHLLYASLVLLVPLVFVNLEQALGVLAKIYPWVVIPVCALALLQVALPADHFLNQQVRGGVEGIASFGEADLVRVAGPFSYVSGMAAFVSFSSLLGFGLFVAGHRSLYFLAGFAFALLALPVTGSRGVIATFSAGVVVTLMSGTAARFVSPGALLRALVMLAVLIAISLSFQDAAWDALQQRINEGHEEGAPRVITAFTSAFNYFEMAGPLGFGTGAANLGSVALASTDFPFSWLPTGSNFEEESGRLVLELGFVGWALSLLMRIAMAIWCINLVLRGMTRSSRLAAALALPFMLSGVHSGNGVFAPSYTAVGYWFFVALLAMAQYESRKALTIPAARRSESLATNRFGRAL